MFNPEEDFTIPSIGRFIFHKRREKKMTQQEFSECIGISRVKLGWIETNKSKIDIELAFKISQELGFPFSVFEYYKRKELDERIKMAAIN